MKALYEHQFVETMIRGTLGMLNDKQRMTDREAALQYVLEQTGANTEEDIRPIMRTMSCDRAMEINLGVGKFIRNNFVW